MTLALRGEEVAARVGEKLPGSVVESSDSGVLVKKEALFGALSFLKTAEGLDFDYLTGIIGVDYRDYFELVYHLTSIRHNHSVVLKSRCHDRDNASVRSAVVLWQAADYQEREIFDLLGIRFEGHPNLKHIVLWEGFEGHPLRKDYK